MEFYRYEVRRYDSENEFGNIFLTVITYDLVKETPKGYWISDKLHSPKKWISKMSRKRWAYPTKKEALNNFIKRTQRRIKILNHQTNISKISLEIAKNQMQNLESL